VAGPALRNLKLWKTMLRDKEHRYFKCPGCGQRLRVPRGKGRISINCRSCGAAFERNT
jgi:transcription elongation factor Elf1